MITESEGYKRLRDEIDRNATKWGNGHDYEGKLAWIVERAQHYADMTGLDASDILNAWEKQRDYWFMNFFQEAKQPRIDAGVRVFETQEALREAVGTLGFRCPACAGVSKSPYTCDSGIVRNGETCNWKSYGLFGTLGKGCSIFVKDKMVVHTVFMPLAFEGGRMTIREILIEFGKGCSCGKPGECEPCLDAAVRAILAAKEKK